LKPCEDVVDWIFDQKAEICGARHDILDFGQCDNERRHRGPNLCFGLELAATDMNVYLRLAEHKRMPSDFRRGGGRERSVFHSQNLLVELHRPIEMLDRYN
jgi:hypothetical protein